MDARLDLLRHKRKKGGKEMKREDVEYYEVPWGKEPRCKKCHSDVYWVDCPNCEDGYSSHDCGEDTCCCLDPVPNVVCDWCNGEGGHYHCPICDGKEGERE